MARTSFRQSDLERVFRAAKSVGSAVQVDLKTLVVTVLPAEKTVERPSGLVPDGPENWDDTTTNGRSYGRVNWDD